MLSTLRRRLCLFVAGQDVVPALPRAQEVETSEFLRQLHGLVYDALLLFVVPDLDKAGQRKIFPQRMAAEAVIGQEAPQIGVAFEENAVKVVGLPLEPVGGGKDAGNAFHRRRSIGGKLEAQAQI